MVKRVGERDVELVSGRGGLGRLCEQLLRSISETADDAMDRRARGRLLDRQPHAPQACNAPSSISSHWGGKSSATQLVEAYAGLQPDDELARHGHVRYGSGPM
jgi:hypothetical protein